MRNLVTLIMTLADLIIILQTEFAIDEAINEDTPLLSSGIISSIDFARLINLFEEKLGQTLDLSDIGYDNFDTPAQMFTTLSNARGHH